MMGWMTDQGGRLSADARALLDAVTAMSSDLELHNVLDRIVASACRLTGARYGALGVIGGHETLSDFVTYGIDDRTHAAIGELPHGRGILGLLIRHPLPLRMPRLQDHPDSYGFPPNHPPMTSFLGMPVRIRGTVFGNLYLTEKEGGVPFTEEDERLLEALATAAGFVIENARAYSLSERQRAWLETATRLNDSLRPGISLDEALQQVALATRTVSAARAVGLFRITDDGPRLVAADGREADDLPEVVAEVVAQMTAAGGGASPEPVQLDGKGLALVLPLRTHLLGPKVMVVLLDGESRDLGLEHKELDLVAAFADQAALALDRVQAFGDRETLAIVSDRDRIARDLHDLVIQRLFATGLNLQSARAHVISPVVGEKLDEAVADLDTTIRDIRSTIFQLQQPGRASLRSAVLELASEYSEVLGFAPSTRIDGPVDTLVPDRVGEHLAAVLREGLSNAARHASASSVEIELAADPERVRLRIADNGVGIQDSGRESGLLNARRRAEALGGSMTLSAHSPRGTVLDWSVPLADG